MNERQGDQRTQLDKLNAKYSPISLAVGLAMTHEGFNNISENSHDMRVIGLSLITLAAIGISDRISDFRSRRQEVVVFESPSTVLVE